MSFVSKVSHILRTEGPLSLANRSVRYAGYRARRAMTDPAPAIREWEALKGKYEGRAFLLGNGPSLNHTPLHLLDGEATMCFNRFDLMLERLPWTPTFYTTIDDRVLLDTIDVVNDMSLRSEYAFFPDIHPYFVDFRSRIEKRSNVHWLFLDRTSFSDELPYCGINKTVANVGIQILAFLGFTEIYLLGVDMTYTVPKSAKIEGKRDITATEDDDESHFDPRYFGKGRKFHVPMLDETFLKFREAYEHYTARGVQIVNSTVGGVLEEFPRKPLEEVLDVDPQESGMRFRRMVESKLEPTAIGSFEALASSPVVGQADEVDPAWRVFQVPSEGVNPVITKWVFDFVPFGPSEGRHYFVRRDSLRA